MGSPPKKCLDVTYSCKSSFSVAPCESTFRPVGLPFSQLNAELSTTFGAPFSVYVS